MKARSISAVSSGFIVALVAALIASLVAAQPASANGGFELPIGSEADEMFFYRDDGLFAYYKVGYNGVLGTKLISGTGYTKEWSEIVAIDLDGDRLDEMFFYRDDGLFAFYDVRPDGSLGTKFLTGTGYTKGWSSIVPVDLDGDRRDELFFYRDDGLFAFYKVGVNGALGTKLFSGTGYTKGWSEINAIDLDGDGRDEMFFYRDDGLFAFYKVGFNGVLGTKLLTGTGYTKGWSSIAPVDLDGDRLDELFFYRDDGLFAFYKVGFNGTLGTKLYTGTGYTKGWSSITAVNTDLPPVPFSFGDGIHRVGSDIPPGTYRQASAQPGCYWARLSGFSGAFEDIIANEFTYHREIVTIKSGDVGFESDDCGKWSKLLNPLSRSTTAPFGDGIYLVGHEVAPGLWRNSDSSQGCYWERLSGFSGEFGEIITNDFTTSQSIVTISDGDVGFSSDDCGTWTYLGQ